MNLPSQYQIGDKVRLLSVSSKVGPVVIIGVRFRRCETGVRVSYEIELKDPPSLRVVFETSLAPILPTPHANGN